MNSVTLSVFNVSLSHQTALEFTCDVITESVFRRCRSIYVCSVAFFLPRTRIFNSRLLV